MSKKILLVDDEQRFRERMARALTERGYIVAEAGTTTEAINLAESFTPDFAIIDLKMPGDSGLTLMGKLKELCPAVRAVYLTGYGSIATAVEAVKLGAVHYFSKPTDLEQIIETLEGRKILSSSPEKPPVIPSLSQVEYEHLNRVVQDFGGNISKAAKALSLHRRSLQRKLAKIPVAVKDRK